MKEPRTLPRPFPTEATFMALVVPLFKGCVNPEVVRQAYWLIANAMETKRPPG